MVFVAQSVGNALSGPLFWQKQVSMGREWASPVPHCMFTLHQHLPGHGCRARPEPAFCSSDHFSDSVALANGRSQDIISRGDSEHLLSQAQLRLLYSSRPHSAWLLPLAALDRSASLSVLGNVTLSFLVSLADSEVGRFNEVKLNLYSDPKWLKEKNNNREVLNWGLSSVKISHFYRVEE